MSDSRPTSLEDGQHSSRGKLGMFLKESLNRGTDELLKGKLVLEHTLGLGPKPNVIPAGEAIVNGEQRTVEIGWHPVGGFGGKWFAERTGLGKMITKEIRRYPDPTQHWAVLVDGFCHELWMDEHLDVIYINEKVNRDEWHTFEVGKTRFNDEALRQAGEMTIHNMRATRPAYNLISNNCQNFAVNMLDAIQIGAHREFATTFAVYQRATGKGAIKDLFVDDHPEEQKPDKVGGGLGEAGGGGASMPPPRPTSDNEVQGSGNYYDDNDDNERYKIHRQDTVQNAQQVMEENTTKLDNHHHSLFS